VIDDYRDFIAKVHAAGGRWWSWRRPARADAAARRRASWAPTSRSASAQRFGVPMGFGGPHAAFWPTRRVPRARCRAASSASRSTRGASPRLRMALQTREQHIRREKATSNICTAQVLLAVMAACTPSTTAPTGSRAIAKRVHGTTATLAAGASPSWGFGSQHGAFFDTVRLAGEAGGSSRRGARGHQPARLRRDGTRVGVALDETVDAQGPARAARGLRGARARRSRLEAAGRALARSAVPGAAARSAYLTHPVFHATTASTRCCATCALERKDLSLTHVDDPAGLVHDEAQRDDRDAAGHLAGVRRLHPFAPPSRRGLPQIFASSSAGSPRSPASRACSLQPNAGSQGEYAGLLVIRAYHQSRAARAPQRLPDPGVGARHQPGLAVMAGIEVVVVACDEHGNVDVADLKQKKAERTGQARGADGDVPVDARRVRGRDRDEICEIVHAAGGQVYMDGANMNAQVGLCRPATSAPTSAT
jgi:glycine dehydrogenase